MFAVSALLCLAVGFASCGNVGDPLPPFVRIPERVKDLAARQEGYDVIVSWTNPARYVDGSLATDLSEAQIVRNGALVATVPVTGAGKAQAQRLPVGETIGRRHVLVLRIATARGRESDPSNEVAIEPLDVPGAVRNLRAVVDQGRIRLGWDPPVDNPNLAQVYLVHRLDRPVGEYVMTPQFDDTNFQPGQMYVYRVTAGRRETSFIPGDGSTTIPVSAVDQAAPTAPTEFQATPSGDGILLTWSANNETDLAGYRVLRSERADGGFSPLHENLHPTNGFFDPASRPGLYYAVSAVDDSGNASPPAVIQR